jgi:hypothetical protein
MWNALATLVVGILKLFLELRPASQTDAETDPALARRLRDLARRRMRQ